MKDSILKGAGNSRFLKSAVPAGTSWADALAMLQAGTFPIDFNGINTEGFQQVGTPLNKANLLKDATAAQIGLPPSTTPDGMFQALGNTGELHVWRKTTVNPAGTTTTYPVSTNPNAYQEGDDAKAAGYVVGDVVTGQFLISDKNNVSTSVAWRFSDDVTVADDGSTSLKDPSSDALDVSNYESSRYDNKFKGKFVSVTKNSTGKCSFDNGIVYFIPNDAIISKITLTSVTFGQQAVVVDRYQPVTGYAAIPAGTTIEYLGKLGDKAMVQVVSYVGTGTYGSSNPNSLTFDFAPKFFAIMGDDDHYGRNAFAIRGANYMGYQFDGNNLANSITWDGAKFSWYSYNNAAKQYNSSGNTYYAIAIG